MQPVIYVGLLHQPKRERLFQVSVGFRVWHESRQLKVGRAVQALSAHEVDGGLSNERHVCRIGNHQVGVGELSRVVEPY